MKIAMIGTGYVGLVSGVCFSDFGHDVVCVDKDPAKIGMLERGEVPIYEPGLDQLMAQNVAAGRLVFTTDLARAVDGADAVFIAVGTPTRRGDGQADLTYVMAAAEEIAHALTGYAVVVTKSTVPVGTNRKVKAVIEAARSDAAFDVASTPEFLRDGAAIARLLAWIDAEAPKGTLTEIDVVTRLEAERAATNALRDISFDTISGAGPNGAIVHYRVTDKTNRRVDAGLLLVASGGQYVDGTTDITRTIAIGDVGAEENTCFTRVLKGMIAMSMLRWPAGLAGRDIECVARVPLWSAGQDFNHGVGHGVGAYLSVHEGPQRLSKVSHVPLQPGMILSNEPGYYREGAFGIRIENLVVVEEAPALPDSAAERTMLNWRTLTFVPIDRRLIMVDMLTTDERDWLNAYHRDVAEKIRPRLGHDAQLWLDAATAPV